MQSYIFWTLLLVVLGLASAGIAVFLRAYLNGTSPSSVLFRQKGERRLEVVDHASVDSRRKLVLIRRDGVEHLVMTGGPVDVVIETGITPPAALRCARRWLPSDCGSRTPRQGCTCGAPPTRTPGGASTDSLPAGSSPPPGRSTG